MTDLHPTTSNAAQIVLDLLSSISNKQSAYRKKNQLSNQLTQARASVISVLIEKGAQSLSSLSENRGVSAATMSKLVSTLVTDGLVLRANSKLDRRSKVFMVTSKGREAAVVEKEAQIQRVKVAIEKLSAEQQSKIGSSVELLTKIMAFL